MGNTPHGRESTPRLLGRYALYQELAAGGIGSVCLARMRAGAGFSRVMAVKRLHPHHAKDAQFVAMFLDEARMAARIRHPNVASVLDVVVSSDDEPFLVMEYVAGESLAKLLAAIHARGTSVEPAIATSIMSGLLEGLHAAHHATNEQGVPLRIVHRDVSPQNVLVGTDGIARVVDFGIAKAVGRLQESTQAGQLKGKLIYMSPEQFADAKQVDCRSDVWAASVLLWEMLVGRQLFPEVGAALRYQSGVESIARPSELGAPDVLDSVVMKGLARAADERFQTAREMLVAMERAVTPAPPRRVAQWVQKFARKSLLERAKYVEQIEADAARASAALRLAPATVEPAEAAAPSVAGTMLSTGDLDLRIATRAKATRRRSLGTWLALTVLVCGLGAAAFLPGIRAQIGSRRAAEPRPEDPPAPIPLPAKPAVVMIAASTPLDVRPPIEASPPANAATAAPMRSRGRAQTTRHLPPARVAPTPTPAAPKPSDGDPLDLRSRE